MLCSSQGHSALGSEIRIESRQKTLGYHHYIVLYSQVYLIHLGTEIDVLFPLFFQGLLHGSATLHYFETPRSSTSLEMTLL